MARLTFVVPAGAEAAALRGVRARTIVVPAGARAPSALPPLVPGTPVIAVGLCGALGDLRTGDVVVYDSVADAATGVTLRAHAGWNGVVRDALAGAHAVAALTTATVVTRAAARAALRVNGDAVDMEGVHLARALEADGTRWTMVRVVSDDARYDLPPIENVVRSNGTVDPARITIAFARAPLAAARFVAGVRTALAVLRRTVRELDRTLGA